MIKLDISVALFIYLLITVVGVFLLWAWLDRASKFKPFKTERKDMWQCSVCSFVYTDRENQELSRCPRCKRINKKGVA